MIPDEALPEGLAHSVDTSCSGCSTRCPLASLLSSPDWTSFDRLVSEVRPVLGPGQEIIRQPGVLQISCRAHSRISYDGKEKVGTFWE